MLGRFGRRRDRDGGQGDQPGGPQGHSRAVVAGRPAALIRSGLSRSMVDPGEGVDSLLKEIAVIEAAAAELHGRHGLPDQLGHYRRCGSDGPWEKVADHLAPAEKWALIQAAPPEEGWRFASLESLGARSDIAEVRQAAAVLAACRGLRQRLTEAAPISPQDLADAIRLGASWRRLSMADLSPPDLSMDLSMDLSITGGASDAAAALLFSPDAPEDEPSV